MVRTRPVFAQTVTYEALSLSNKRFPPQSVYTIGCEPISWKYLVRYLGVCINSKLTWSDHCRVTVSRASKVLNVLRQTMFGCSAHAKNVAYKSIVRPCLEYACVVWSPHSAKDSKHCLRLYRTGLLGGL